MKSRLALCVALGVVLLGLSTAAFAQGTSSTSAGTGGIDKDELSLGIVGQVQNSAGGVLPATSIEYGHLSYLRGLIVFTGPPNESTALFTFYIDTTTTQVVNDGPMRVIDRKGSMTQYSHC